MVDYPSAIIITVDDDLYYHRNLVKELYEEYLENPDCIHCHRVTKIVWKNNMFSTITGGYEYYNNPSFLNKLSGGAGCLYPPGILSADVIKEDVFMNIAPTSDDIWFWAMAVINGVRISVVRNNHPYLHYIKGTQESGLYRVNDFGPSYFRIHFNLIMDKYPVFKQNLLNELRREKIHESFITQKVI